MGPIIISITSQDVAILGNYLHWQCTKIGNQSHPITSRDKNQPVGILKIRSNFFQTFLYILALFSGGKTNKGCAINRGLGMILWSPSLEKSSITGIYYWDILPLRQYPYLIWIVDAAGKILSCEQFQRKHKILHF